MRPKLESRAVHVVSRRLDKLGNTVNDLFQEAIQNETILHRFQRFELRLFDVEGFKALLEMLLLESLEYFQLDCVELWLYDPQETLAELLADDEPVSGLRLMAVNSELLSLYGKRPQVRLISIDEGTPLPVFGDQPLQSVALLPLVRHGMIVGSLHFGARGCKRFNTDKSTDFMSHLASVVSVCFENAVNRERLHRLSMYDMLTQVKNRRAFQYALDKEVSRAARNGDCLSLLFIDLDYFKKINDSYGHPVGDRVLKAVAQCIHHLLRKTDHVCRYGGEEFALVLPDCGRQRAMEVAERLRQKISELKVSDDDDGVVSVTLSTGICCWSPMADDDESQVGQRLISCSDQGVYQSKAAGRNCFHYVPFSVDTSS